ncbi:hypothetical protein KEM55_003416 [Ascosphaera atra]|nr:hypothetical protein KEM55_003416 [Ascosphaera atra]
MPRTPRGKSRRQRELTEEDDEALLALICRNIPPSVVDLNAAAKSLGYKNPRSFGDRLGQLKAKHGLKLSGTLTGSAVAEGAEGNEEAEQTSKQPETKTVASEKTNARRVETTQPKSGGKKAVDDGSGSSDDEGWSSDDSLSGLLKAAQARVAANSRKEVDKGSGKDNTGSEPDSS